MRSWQVLCVLLALAGTLLLGIGCASRQQEPTVDHRGFERPARALSEEESVVDRAGQVAVVIVVIAVVAGLIALPILLFL
jgi:uncharacterized membrane protein YidH (DUF202 family)